MLITIITINYNNIEGLKKTFKSVMEQTYSKIEYIVIDGGSDDGSKEYIESRQQEVAYWVSEKDGGIYDAMNKGIDQATGDYLLFLNSGDWLVDNLVIEKFVEFEPVEDIIYGDHYTQKNDKCSRQYMPKTMTVGTALSHTINHQSIFYSSNVFVNNRYNLDYKLMADWVLTNNAIIFNKNTTRYIDLVVCYYDINGISSDFNLRHQERKRYLKENFDPLFLILLKDYKKLNSETKRIKATFFVQAALKLAEMKLQLTTYFKSK